MNKQTFQILICAIFLMTALTACTNAPQPQNNTETTLPNTAETEITDTASALSASTKSLFEYYKTRYDFYEALMTKDPNERGFMELAKVKVECPKNADGPCGYDLLIVSKEALHSGNQEFYLAQAGGAGYSYFGPFTDNLESLVNESKTIGSFPVTEEITIDLAKKEELQKSLKTPDFLDEKLFVDSFGKYAFDVFEKHPEILTSIQKLKPDFEAKNMGVAAPVQMARIDNSDWLILSGCAPHACGTTDVIAVYNPASYKTYLLEAKPGYSVVIYNDPDTNVYNLLLYTFVN